VENSELIRTKHSALFPSALSALGNISAFLGICGEIPVFYEKPEVYGEVTGIF